MEDISVEMIELENSDELIDEIMKRHGNEILKLVFSYVNNKTVAEDLTQDIFVKCYRSIHTYNRKAKFRTWLWRIAINHCKDYLKSWYNKNVVFIENTASSIWTEKDLVEKVVIQKDDDIHLVNTVMDLPIKYREVIYLYYFEGLTIKEISLLLDVKGNTVKSRMKRAKEILKERLEE
ncbi:RNA polymerase subunit sigma [Heyndrickxia sporothermodurans]|nr:RNA polymerase subunit sigma [Heyndrickxia sporothermodurans]